MAIGDDIAVDETGNIYYTGAAHGAAGAGYYTVLELHRWLQDLADNELSIGDDRISIINETPSDRSTDNIITVLDGYRLDDANGSATDAISEHLFDGSIIQQEDGTIWDGLTVIASEGMDLQIIQNGALIANDFWNSVPDGETEKGLNRLVAAGLSHRFMIKTVDAGTDIDGRRIVGITRVVGSTYSEFKSTCARGNNVLALNFANDLNDATDASGRTDVTNIEGYRLIDIDGDSIDEPYYSEWTRGGNSINQMYERLKWLTACESGTTAVTANGSLYGLDGNIFRGITHQVEYSGLSGGTFAEATTATFANGATFQIYCDNGTDKFWGQVLTGVVPSSGGVSVGGVSATVTTNVEKTVPTPFVGVSTGSALIGAYGLGMDKGDVSASDILTDLEGITRLPPNNVQFVVNGLVAGEDRVLVGPYNGTDGIQENQAQLTSGISAGATSISTSGNAEASWGTGSPSGTDTPTSGTIRILGDDNIFYMVSYTSRTMGSGTITFEGCSGAPTAAAGKNVFISYIDKLADSTSASFTVVYSGTPRSLFVRVRDGGTAGDNEGIKTFESPSTLGSAGGSTTAIRTSDV